MFIDEVTIQVRSGKGGDGAVHFRREKYVPRGGPDGGNGGEGGDVVLVMNPVLNTLSAFRHRMRFQAEDGRRGGPNNRTGRSGADCLIPVPPGTLVYDDQTGVLLGDLVEAGQRLVVCKGGRGGRGNAAFTTARNRAPRLGERGEPAQERTLRLELKLLADVGIVGVPNAGKTTLLSVVTNARPKIAPYPFTTLIPNLGVAELDPETTLVLADIPGLVEGAHQGVGLGDAFLRHVQRTRVLIHLLDGLAEDPLADFAQINSELALFDPKLGTKPQVVAFNKMDLPEVQARWPQVREQLEARGIEPIAISAVAGTQVRQLLYRAYQLYLQVPEPVLESGMPVYRLESDPEAYEIARTDGGWRVRGVAIERAAAMTYWEYDQSVRRFQRILRALGVEEALREAGVQPGDTIHIGEYELEWQD